MSETLFAAPATEQEAPAVPAEESGTDQAQRRKMLALVGAAVVAVVAIAGYFVMKGGSTDETAAAPLPVHRHPAAAAPAAPNIDSKTFPNLPAVFKDVVGRDPFKPLVVDKPAAPAAQAPAPTTVVPVAPTGTTAGAPATVPTAQPDWISLESQSGVKSATFLVHSTDGKAVGYTDVPAPADGKTTAFGGYFALISLQDGFAVVQMGDSKPFNVQVGYTNRHMLN